jgi:hypothetical protein
MSSKIFSHIDICSKEADEVINIIKKSFPDECVISIDKIINLALQKKYNDRLQMLKSKRGEDKVKEVKLFHGTDFKSVENIAHNGFLCQYSRVNSFGIGTYFAKDYSYSRNYSINKGKKVKLNLFHNYDNMILSKVILGIPTRTNGGKYTDINLYDYSCDNLQNSTIFSIPYDDAAYPEYVISFYNEKNSNIMY